jgi:hypothetical protein
MHRETPEFQIRAFGQQNNNEDRYKKDAEERQ